jgi:hypothetical protein
MRRCRSSRENIELHRRTGSLDPLSGHLVVNNIRLTMRKRFSPLATERSFVWTVSGFDREAVERRNKMPDNKQGSSDRGFASMDEETQREIARKRRQERLG